MVLVRDGRTEQRHEAVTEELIDGAFVTMHFGQRNAKKWLSTPCIASAPTFAASGVELAMSQNNTVTCFLSPSKALLEVRIFSARCLGVYCCGDA